MGIKPSGSSPVVVPPDNVQSRWGAWEASIDVAGQQAGEVFAETHAIATSANSTAILLIGKAEDALAKAEQGLDEIGGLNDQLFESIDPDDPSAQQWVWLSEIHRLQAEIDSAQNEAIVSNTELLRKITEDQWHLIKVAGKVGYVGDFLRVDYLRHRVETRSGVLYPFHDFRVTALGGFNGYLRDTTGQVLYQFTDHNRVYEYSRSAPLDSSAPAAEHFFEFKAANIDPGFTDLKRSSFTADRGTWVNVPDLSFTSTAKSIHYINVRGTWTNATYIASYGLRVMVNGVEKKRVFGTNVGPLIHHAPRSQSFSTQAKLEHGDVVTVQAYADHDNSLNRLLSNCELGLGWVPGSESSEAAE